MINNAAYLVNIEDYIRSEASEIIAQRGDAEAKLQRIFDRAANNKMWRQIIPATLVDHLNALATLDKCDTDKWCSTLERLVRELFFSKSNIFIAIVCAIGFKKASVFAKKLNMPARKSFDDAAPTTSCIENEICHAYIFFLLQYVNVATVRLNIKEIRTYLARCEFRQSGEGCTTIVSFACHAFTSLDFLGDAVRKLETSVAGYGLNNSSQSEAVGQSTKKTDKNEEIPNYHKWKAFFLKVLLGFLALLGIHIESNSGVNNRTNCSAGFFQKKDTKIVQEIDDNVTNFLEVVAYG